MNITVKENPPPPPPPKRYVLDISQEEMDILRYFAARARPLIAAVRFLDKTRLYASGTWTPSECFKD